jgi:hypothetical protein
MPLFCISIWLNAKRVTATSISPERTSNQTNASRHPLLLASRHPSFANHPLSYVLRTMNDLYVFGLTAHQEPNHIRVDERYFFQVQNGLAPVFIDLSSQFLNVLPFKVTNQTNRCLSASRILFDLQSPLASIGASSCRVSASGVPTQSIESAGPTAREIADFQEMPIFRQIERDHRCGGTRAQETREDVREGWRPCVISSVKGGAVCSPKPVAWGTAP